MGQAVGFDDLPEGAQILNPQSAPAQQTAEPSFSDLPQGAQVMQEPQAPDQFTDVPQGAQIVAQGASMPDPITATLEGIFSGNRELYESGQALGGQATSTPDTNPAAQPFDLGTMPDSGTLSKIGYRLGKSEPMMVGGMMGAAAGSEFGPAGILTGGAIGAGSITAIQSLGPRYKAELDKTPNDPDSAWNRTMKGATTDGLFAGAAWAAFPVRFFGSVLKKVVQDGVEQTTRVAAHPAAELAAQGLGVQPAIGLTQNAVNNAENKQPLGQNAANAYVESAVGTLALPIGHEAVKRIAVPFMKKAPSPVPGDIGPGDVPPPPPGFEYSADNGPELPGLSSPDQTGPQPPMPMPAGGPTQPAMDRASVPAERAHLDALASSHGLKVVETRDTIYLTDKSGQSVGRAYWRNTSQGPQFGNINIEEPYQRKGFATTIQNYLEMKTGKPMIPDFMLSNAEHSRWMKVDPTKVANHVKMDENFWAERMDIRPPLQQARQNISGPKDLPQTNMDPFDVPAVEDVAETGPMLGNLISSIKTLVRQYHKDADEAVQDQQPRYIIGDGADSILHNAIDLEQELALRGNEGTKPKISRVDLNTLNPEDITSHYSKLPPWGSKRISFRNSSLHPDDLGRMYEDMRSKFGTGLHNQGEGEYKYLLDQGLRVVPEAGDSFLYGGERFVSHPVEGIPSSRRADVQLYSDPNGIVIGEQREGELGRTTVHRLAPVVASVDLAKLEPDTFISADVNDISSLKDFSSIKTDDLNAWSKAAREHDYGTIKRLYKKGVYVPIKWNEQNRPHTLFNESKYIVAVKDLPFASRAHGYADVPLTDREFTLSLGKYKGTNLKSDLISIDQTSFRPSLDEVNHAKDIARDLLPVAQVIDRVLERLAAVHRPTWNVIAGGQESPSVWTSRGVIQFPTVGFDRTTFVGDRKAKVAQIAWHEVGHLVTANMWAKTPLHIKATIIDAYNRARLAWNVVKDPSQTAPPRGASYDASEGYYLKFEEYLAEQFRRWMNSNSVALGIQDQFFKEGAAKLLEVQKEMESYFTQKQIQQSFQSHWAFNSWMDYAEYAARKGDSPLQMAKHAAAMQLEAPVAGDAAEAMKAVNSALDQFEHVIANDIMIDVRPEADIGEHIVYGSMSAGRVMRLMVGSFAWIKDLADMPLMARRIVAHEAFHGIEHILSGGQRAVLTRAAKAAGVLPKSLETAYRSYFKKWFIDQGLDDAAANAAAERYVDSEHMAALIESRANGESYGPELNTFMDKFTNFFTKVGNLLVGRGYNTAGDLVHDFYRGELTRRYNERAVNRKMVAGTWQNGADISNMPKVPTGHGDLFVDYRVLDADGKTNGRPEFPQFNFYSPTGQQVGQLHFMLRPEGGYEIGFIGVRDRRWWGKGVPTAMLEHAQNVLGERMKVAGTLTKQGYRMVGKMYPTATRNYVYDKRQELWFSPKMIWKTVQAFEDHWAGVKDDSSYSETEKITVKNSLAHWKRLADQIPPLAADDPMLQHQWAQRDYVMSEFDKAQKVITSRTVYQSTGDTSHGPIEDAYTAAYNADVEGMKNSPPKSGYSTDAPPQPAMNIMRGLQKNLLRSKRGDKDKDIEPFLNGSLIARGDKAGWIAKNFMTIRQVMWRNPDIEPLRDYVSSTDQMKQRANEWISRAFDVSKKWDHFDEKQRDGLSNLLFWATEMNYRTKQEVSSGVVRQPTATELANKARSLGLDRNTLAHFGTIGKEFGDFLTQMEAVFDAQIQRRINDPVVAAAERAKLKADMNNLRRKPYFPMVRFGEWTITARDSQDINPATGRGRVSWFSAYATAAERDAAFHKVRQQLGPLHELDVGTMPEEMTDFMGLPGPLLDRIATELPNVTPAQKDWLERFNHLMAPEQSFKKRWLQRKGTPGYSLDGVRSYSQYFRSASRYLARIEFMDDINNSIKGLKDRADRATDSEDPRKILSMVQDHAEYISTPGQDWHNLKAFFTNWRLAFHVSSAFTNLTQVPMVTYPYLSSLFGEKAALAMGTKLSGSFKRTAGFFDRSSDPAFTVAHDEVVRQGKIDTGQAAELGSFATTDRINSSYAGTAAQRAIREASYYGMFTFGQTERFNREWTFKTAHDLSLADPNNKHNQDMAIARHKEVTDLMSRLGMDHDHAVAFLVGREAIDRTQGVYDAWDRPKFLQGKLAGSLQIFVSYTQQTLFQLFNNPGKLKQWLILGAIAGLSGLPFADDIDKAIRLISRKAFGIDFDPFQEARKHIKQMTSGTIFSEVGPDLFLHGLSRYSYGLGLFPDSWGMPQFDASRNSGMGDIPNGVSDALRAMYNSGTDADAWKDFTAEAAKNASGAGFGIFFDVLQYMAAAPYTSDQKKWEKILPPGLKNAVQAFRLYESGVETTAQGGTIAKFDSKDPNDRATLIAKALGFQPRVLSESYEKQGEITDINMFYKAKKLSLVVQLQQALMAKDSASQAQAVRGIQDYNTEVKAAGYPGLSLSAKSVLASMKSRFGTIQRQSAGIPAQRGAIGVTRDVNSRYPQPPSTPGPLLRDPSQQRVK